MYNNDIEKDIALLPYQKTEYLRDLWQSYFDCPPPKFNKSTLVNRLAYRMQEMEYGGLPQDIKDRIYDAVHGKTPKRKQIVDKPVAGTKLIREHDDIEHHVTVLVDGYEYQGVVYRSLSGIARKITGTNWNGNAFFGLTRSVKERVA
ncbi:DUF2924 domain-containing protein [Pseudemcibacter aquimaris]|uniref:DUF2924 domain-containing protein n=1 Tax=Pseudemcibacter aquimaris TaxID=2857064 RepID=UPI000C3B51CA|nr:DUF2924 domain-containing protein [Pseudemcibacter aquimaris]MAF97726.1 hypothetical protein [Micavibrio sp.]MCC3862524.1 DUF2924 domain-containing protein [Pseudemcibacter aquimaris]WDU57786.1 DUF2924 domain-containing protein [Pseudemcibacter aquimaris]|tara:strand:+ start:383 stop:823 length:441 start_codon:yes stop_codon:yes gene_type:complete